MNSYEIIRNRLPCYNNSKQNIIAERTFDVGKDVISDPINRIVTVESATVDLGQVVLDTQTDRYKIAIWCDLKEQDGKPAGLEYGMNYFTLGQELKTVDQFIKFLTDTLVKRPQPFSLGYFELNNDDYFTRTITQAQYNEAFENNYFRVYFNEELSKILVGFYNDEQEVINDEIYYRMTPSVGIKTSSVDSLYRINKIENILFLTSLPITPTQVLNIRENRTIPMNILSSIELNNLTYSLKTKSDWRYSPNILRYATLTQNNPIENYDIRVMIMYNNTEIRQHVLGVGERFIVNLSFYPRVGVDQY